MNAAVLHTLGTPPRCEQFPEPVAGDGEIIVHVHAASLKPVDKQLASGSHYASARGFPVVCGTDGVGRLSDGQRVFFGGSRAPYGAMAQSTVAPKAFTFPVPDGVDDETAAALPNPGVSAWLSLAFRAKLALGENVLILGATGVTGKLAVKIAKLLGAGRVVAAGRNQQVLSTLPALGADSFIQLDAPPNDLSEAFVRESCDSGFQVVIDYVWGHPAEAFLAAITRKDFAAITSETRYVQVGETAGPAISLPAAVLRSTPLTILGTAGIPLGTPWSMPCNTLWGMLPRETFVSILSVFRSPTLRALGNAINIAADSSSHSSRSDPPPYGRAIGLPNNREMSCNWR